MLIIELVGYDSGCDGIDEGWSSMTKENVSRRDEIGAEVRRDGDEDDQAKKVVKKTRQTRWYKKRTGNDWRSEVLLTITGMSTNQRSFCSIIVLFLSH